MVSEIERAFLDGRFGRVHCAPELVDQPGAVDRLFKGCQVIRRDEIVDGFDLVIEFTVACPAFDVVSVFRGKDPHGAPPLPLYWGMVTEEGDVVTVAWEKA